MISFKTTTLTAIFVILAGDLYAQESASQKFLLIKLKGIIGAIGKKQIFGRRNQLYQLY